MIIAKYCAIFVFFSSLLIPVVDCTSNAKKVTSNNVRFDYYKIKRPRVTLLQRTLRCDFKKKQLRAKSFIEDTRITADLCWFCSKDPCGRNATDLVLGKTQKCLAERIKNCCPSIISIEIDDRDRCDCYCSKTEFIRGSGIDGFVTCPSCASWSASVQTVPPTIPTCVETFLQKKNNRRQSSRRQHRRKHLHRKLITAWMNKILHDIQSINV